MLLILQIMLGGWTSANYAALICPDFPMCQQQWWPAMSLKALNLFGGIGIEHPLAYMDSAEKTSIHMLHRLFALITLVVVGFFSLRLFKSPNAVLKKLAVLLGALLALQVSLGIANVVMSLPLHNAVAHHGTAAILLLTLIAINYVLLRGKRDRG
jgi:cytochrome c oxidase assembly protein subunit 15